MSQYVRVLIAALLVAVFIGIIYLPKLVEHVLRQARPTHTEEQARREITQPPIATPTDVKQKARLYWASPTVPNTLEAAEVELALSADPAQRAKQLIRTLIADAPNDQRTLPADATLLEFYLLPDGTGVADFSDTIATATPSGILSEQMAVDSMVRTLADNMETVRRLKILIHGQDAETLAGHLDLTGFFLVRPDLPPRPSSMSETPEKSAPTKSAPPGKTGPAGLTRPGAPGKMGR
jgi:hypothetical protein